jgi:hypothetical protein
MRHNGTKSVPSAVGFVTLGTPNGTLSGLFNGSRNREKAPFYWVFELMIHNIWCWHGLCE